MEKRRNNGEVKEGEEERGKGRKGGLCHLIPFHKILDVPWGIAHFTIAISIWLFPLLIYVAGM